MTPREQYIELKTLGFTKAMVAKQTGISWYKLNNMQFQDRYHFSDPEKAAFTVYYEVGKYMAKVFGEKLAEYLEQQEEAGNE